MMTQYPHLLCKYTKGDRHHHRLTAALEVQLGIHLIEVTLGKRGTLHLLRPHLMNIPILIGNNNIIIIIISSNNNTHNNSNISHHHHHNNNDDNACRGRCLCLRMPPPSWTVLLLFTC